MKYGLSLLPTAFLGLSAFAQDSSKYLTIERIHISGKTFQMQKDSPKLEQIGGDSLAMDAVNRNRDSTTTRQIPQREGELEDRQFRTNPFEQEARKSLENQYISIGFNNLSGKEIKSVSFQLRLLQKSKRFFERNFKLKPRQISTEKFYVSERFISTTDLSRPNSEREITIKQIEFTDGTKVKF